MYAGMAHKRVDDTIDESSVSGNDSLCFETLLCEVGQDKNKESFVSLFQHFAPRIKSFLIKGGADENSADELAQETMLSVWDKAKSYDPKKAAASTWIFTIARNKRIDALRKIKGYHVDLDDLPVLEDTAGFTPAQDMNRTQESENIIAAMSELPKEQSELIQKSFFEDKSHSEISEETGIPLGTVKSRIRLALDRLRGQEKVKQLWQ